MTTINREEFIRYYITPVLGYMPEEWDNDKLQDIADDYDLLIVF